VHFFFIEKKRENYYNLNVKKTLLTQNVYWLK